MGETTVSSDLSIPSTTEGPGILLPDSPLFFLDELKQNIRLLLAFSPQTRAKVHTAIAGERLAELQFMLAKNNEERIKFALSEVSDNLKKAANDLTQARLKGKDVKLLAKTINELIKDKRKKLSFLEEQAQGELKAQVKAAKEALKAAKIEVEDNLPEDDLEDELEDHVRVASDSARGLEHAIDVLERLASQAGERQETRREEALRHAIEVKNEALIKQQEKALELEHKKQERLLKAKEKFIEKTREALRKAHEAAREFQKDQDEINENDGASENSGSSSSSDSKENSGSGSSGSGRSGSSGSDDDK